MKWYGKHGRKLSRMVKRYENYERKLKSEKDMGNMEEMYVE